MVGDGRNSWRRGDVFWVRREGSVKVVGIRGARDGPSVFIRPGVRWKLSAAARGSPRVRGRWLGQVLCSIFARGLRNGDVNLGDRPQIGREACFEFGGSVADNQTASVHVQVLGGDDGATSLE